MKSLLAGTPIAIVMLALSYGVATSQSVIINDQLQTGDVVSDATLDVVDETDDTTAVTTATANGLSGTVIFGSLDVQSVQETTGATSATSTINVVSNAGEALIATTAATGNTADVGIDGGGELTGNLAQVVGVSPVTAESQINGNNAEAGSMSVGTQAIANSIGFGVTDSSSEVTTTQVNAADVQSNAGSVMQYMPGDAILSSGAIGNNITSATAGTATQNIEATQSNVGGIVQATQFTAFGNSQNTITSATATANNANLTNSGGSLTVELQQDNSAYVRAQAEETSFDYGGATVTAYGVGNSSLVGELGGLLFYSNVQSNSGAGVETVASFSGDGNMGGYDALVSSTAIGNAATGFACSTCEATFQVGNSQVNSSDVSARSQINITNQGRTTRATTTAIGNTASFYITQPGP